jgi:hypothetical protein
MRQLLGYLAGSVADPCPFNTDPDPAVFASDLQDANKKLFFKVFLLITYFLKEHKHHFSQRKSHKKVTKQ